MLIGARVSRYTFVFSCASHPTGKTEPPPDVQADMGHRGVVLGDVLGGGGLECPVDTAAAAIWQSLLGFLGSGECCIPARNS